MYQPELDDKHVPAYLLTKFGELVNGAKHPDHAEYNAQYEFSNWSDNEIREGLENLIMPLIELDEATKIIDIGLVEQPSDYVCIWSMIVMFETVPDELDKVLNLAYSDHNGQYILTHCLDDETNSYLVTLIAWY